MNKLVRITTVPISLEKLLENQLRFMNNYYEVIAISSDEEQLKKIGENQNTRTFSTHLTRKITPLQDLKAVWELYRFFKKEKPYIVHSHTPKAGIVGMLAAKLAGVPNRLHTVAGLPLLEAKGNKRKLLDFVEKITYACATKVYPNSYGLKEIIVHEKFCNPNKLKVIANGSSNGINVDFFNPNQISSAQKLELKNKLGIAENDFVFVFVGRIVSDKGINELVAAFNRLTAETVNLKLLLVGPFEHELDPLLPITQQIINQNPHIITTGYQNDVRSYFAISHCLVFPNYRDGFPNVVLQAGAMGLPSIVSNINGCNEIVIEGENGVVIPVKDTNAVYEMMKKIVLNIQFREKLRQNARSMIVSRYEQQVVWEAILGEYSVLEKQD